TPQHQRRPRLPPDHHRLSRPMAEVRRRFRWRRSFAFFGAGLLLMLCLHVWYVSTAHVTCGCVLSADGRSVETKIVVTSYRGCDVFVITRTPDGTENIESESSGWMWFQRFPWCLSGLTTFRSEETSSRGINDGTRVELPPAIERPSLSKNGVAPRID